RDNASRASLRLQLRALRDLFRNLHVVNGARVVDGALLGRWSAVRCGGALLLALSRDALVGMVAGSPFGGAKSRQHDNLRVESPVVSREPTSIDTVRSAVPVVARGL